MAMNKDRLGDAIKAAVLALNGSSGGLTGGEHSQLQAFCRAIANEIIEEIKNNADIDLQAADIPVDPGTFANGAGPVLGTGTSQAILIPAGRIK